MLALTHNFRLNTAKFGGLICAILFVGAERSCLLSFA
jgi:hypothetical protein